MTLAVLGGRAFAQEWIDAEVRRIDKEGARLTLKHAEIKSMDMPAMTMVFRVRDKAMLEGLSVGDRVRVQAVREAGQFVVVELRRAP
jgi:Cu/Ag efflux protein CusF